MLGRRGQHGLFGSKFQCFVRSVNKQNKDQMVARYRSKNSLLNQYMEKGESGQVYEKRSCSDSVRRGSRCYSELGRCSEK